MVRFPKVLLGLFVAVGVTIAGCNGATDIAEPPPAAVETPAEGTVEDGGTTADESKETADAAPTVESQANDTASETQTKPETVAVSIYVMDDSCSSFKAESVEVSASEPMSEAVGEVLDRHEFEAFKLSGYRVKVENSKAIVDLRLAEDSERQFLSLSSCEQQGLFGGLEETLMQNPSWEVEQVEFTNRGKEIVL
ncbi:MAG: sporulation/spore germination protein [Cyanobacteria bacterium P01_B01_bin.77]